VGTYGCRLDGLDEVDTMERGREGGREGLLACVPSQATGIRDFSKGLVHDPVAGNSHVVVREVADDGAGAITDLREGGREGGREG